MMGRHIGRFFRQPLAAYIMTAAAALVAIPASWGASSTSANWVSLLLVATSLVVLTVIADMYPVHVGYHTKTSITTLLLYLIAVMLPPVVAGIAAGLSRLIAELLERSKRGSFPSDIVTGIARWALLAMVTAWVAHVPVQSDGRTFAILIGAAVVMFVVDALSIVFELAPISGDPPQQILITTVKAVGVFELIQYNLGILAALAVHHHFWELTLLVGPVGIAYRAFKNIKETRDSTRQLLESLADAVDLRDPYTGGHSRRVTEHTAAILRELELSGPDAELIILAARVHDIGKIGVPDAVLNKPDKLTVEEWAIMTSHSARGADLLARYSDFARGVEIVRHHHERWDGKGYPAGLVGAAIPFGARVIAVADGFDAMTSDRPYRQGMPIAQAAQILRDDGGRQWDVRIVDAFLRTVAYQLPQPGPMMVLGFPTRAADHTQLVATSSESKLPA